MNWNINTKLFFFQLGWLAFLVLWILGQLQRIQVTSTIAIYAFDVVIGCWLIGVTVSGYVPDLIKKIQAIFKHKAVFFLSGWVVLGLVIAGLQGQNMVVPLLYLARYLVYSLFILSIDVIKPFSILKLRFSLISAGLLMLFLGLLQYFFIPDTKFLAILGWDDHYYRLIGTVFDPGYTGMLFIITFWLSEIRNKNNWQWLIRVGLMLGILLTYSRASYLAFLVSLVFIILSSIWQPQKSKAFVFTALAFLFIAAVPVLPQPQSEGVNLTRTASIQTRTQNIDDSLRTLQLNEVVLGRGLFVNAEDRVPPSGVSINTARVPDNLEIFLLVSTGGVGLLVTLFILGQFGFKLYYQDEYLLAAFIALLIHTQFNNTFLQPFVFLYFWLGIALFKPKTS